MQDFEQELKSRKLQMNVILDMVGGDYISKNLSSLAQDGRYAVHCHRSGLWP